MNTHNLDVLFRPQSVAVIGASKRPLSVGLLTMEKLLQGGFDGPIMPVHPRHRSVAGVLTYPSVDSLPEVPDLAVICTPPKTVPLLIGQLGRLGTKAAIVITAGLADQRDEHGRTLREAMLAEAAPSGMRILGNNTVGLLVPGIGLNATFAHTIAKPGSLAFVGQSGGIFTSVLDYAVSNNIGFSHFISLGDTVDVDFGDCLDYLGRDSNTRAILLYSEFVTNPRKFLSAARAAARRKPVLVVKSGRVPEGARAAASHTGALAGSDEVYEAAFRRAGILRVFKMEELFDAAETLSRARPISGDRLAILTNGGGPGVVAGDSIVLDGAKLAQLSQETIARLDTMLPRTWSRQNPVDIIGDTPGEYYGKVLAELLTDPGVDAVLAMHAPVSLISAEDAARSVAEVASKSKRTVLTSWIGESHQHEARRILRQAGVPTYATPEQACRAFMHLVRFRQEQRLLLETPPSASNSFVPDKARVRAILNEASAQGRTMLSEPESKGILAAYGIPVVLTRIVRDLDEAVKEARQIGFPVALKILSADISHKSDVGGVALDIDSEYELRSQFEIMTARVRALRPDATIDGFTVQQMARRPGAHELIIGVATDPVFGPVILFGHGGTAVEVIQDRAVTLPPLNLNLARDLVQGTRIFEVLKGYRDRPAANLNAIYLALNQVSQLLVDFAEIRELDINPLFADPSGVLALDARVVIEPNCQSNGSARLSICPYPSELEEPAKLSDGRTVILRPLKPEDEKAHFELFGSLTDEDIRFRFFSTVKRLTHEQMAVFTQIDYDREMAFIATTPEEIGAQTLGAVRAVPHTDDGCAEFAMSVHPKAKKLGVGELLVRKMIAYLADRGRNRLVCYVHVGDRGTQRLLESLGFGKQLQSEGNVYRFCMN